MMMYMSLYNIMANTEVPMYMEGRVGSESAGTGMGYMFYESRSHIVPISEMRDTSRMSSLAEDGMVCVTKNGYAHLRIMSERAYRDLMDRLEFLETVYSCERMKNGLDGETVEEAVANARARNGL